MLSHALRALVVGLLDLVLVVELARESRMVVHVTVGTIHSFVLGLLLVGGPH